MERSHYSIDRDDGLHMRRFYEPDSKGHLRLIGSAQAMEVLIESSGLKYLRIYPANKLIYLYLPHFKCYRSISAQDLSLIIATIFRDSGMTAVSECYIASMIKDASVQPVISYMGSPEGDINHSMTAVTSGVVNMSRKAVILNAGPSEFVVHYLPYACDPETEVPRFERCMRDISPNVQEKSDSLRALLSMVIWPQAHLQCCFYIYGPGGSGKSSFTNIARAVVGEESTQATTLRALSSHMFEAFNLYSNRLILMGDTEHYTAGLSKLKALTGGDALRGRAMRTQATRPISLAGVVILTVNKLLGIRDPSGAMDRRMRAIKIDHVPVERVDLLYRGRDGSWQGELVAELPGILALAVSNPQEHIDTLIRDFTASPSPRRARSRHSIPTVPSESTCVSVSRLERAHSWVTSRGASSRPVTMPPVRPSIRSILTSTSRGRVAGPLATTSSAQSY